MKDYSELWLCYRKTDDRGFLSYYKGIGVEGFRKTPVILNAVKELQKGFKEMLFSEA